MPCWQKHSVRSWNEMDHSGSGMEEMFHVSVNPKACQLDSHLLPTGLSLSLISQLGCDCGCAQKLVILN